MHPRAELVQIVNHKHSRLFQRPKLRRQAFDHRLTLETRCRIDPLHDSDRTPQRVDDRLGVDV
jgi:hypothetical protein